MVDEGPSQWDNWLSDGEGISKEIAQEKRRAREQSMRGKAFLEKVHLEAVKRSSAKKVRQEFLVKIDEAKAREKRAFRVDLPHLAPRYVDEAILFYFNQINKERQLLLGLSDSEIYLKHKVICERITELLEIRKLAFKNLEKRWEAWLMHDKKAARFHRNKISIIWRFFNSIKSLTRWLIHDKVANPRRNKAPLRWRFFNSIKSFAASFFDKLSLLIALGFIAWAVFLICVAVYGFLFL